MRPFLFTWHAFCSVLLACLAICQPVHASAEGRQLPNIVLIVADDIGWADLGSFGSEIRTPNIDTLARGGLTYTQFRVAPTCSPTRAMLLTGLDHHLAGLGTMEGLQTDNQRDSVYYQAEFHDGVITLSEVLSRHGYATAMAGKWHLAKSERNYPGNRGFDHSFTLLQGGASHFGDALPLHQNYVTEYLENDVRVEVPADFYSSIAYTDKLISYLGDIGPERPFFAYLAFTAPHDPLQVPDDWLNRYQGEYTEGPEATRLKRIAKQKALGLLPLDVKPSPPLTFPAWTPMGKRPWSERTEEQRLLDARPMEIYAAMIELLDKQVGRLIAELDAMGVLDNTYIIFMSDNGAAAATPLAYPDTSRDWFLTERKQDLASMGRSGSHTYLGREWAAVSNAPFRLFKATVAEGGIRVPFIVSGPGIIAGERTDISAHAIDLTPTALDLAGIAANGAEYYEGKLLPQGESMLGTWRGVASGQEEDRARGFELFGNRAIVQGRWKATSLRLPLGSGGWELYDLQLDPGETVDLAEQNPGKLAQLTKRYDDYVVLNNVISPLPPILRSPSVLYAGECSVWCKFQFWVIDLVVKIQVFLRGEGG